MKDLDDSKAPLLEHLIELRGLSAQMRRGAPYGLCAVLLFLGHAVRDPCSSVLKDAFGPAGGKLVYTKLYEAFFVQVKVALFGSFVPDYRQPVVGLCRAGTLCERKEGVAALPAGDTVAVHGRRKPCLFCRDAILFTFSAISATRSGLQVEALPSADAYLGLVMQFILAFGICFLLPVLLMLLNHAGLVTRAQLVGLRRYMIVVVFIVAAVLTPPDVVSQLMLAVPLVLLYELALIAMWFTDRKRRQDEGTALVSQD